MKSFIADDVYIVYRLSELFEGYRGIHRSIPRYTFFKITIEKCGKLKTQPLLFNTVPTFVA